MNMKKVLTTLLAATCMLTMAGCASTYAAGRANNKVASEATTEAATAATTQEEAAATTQNTTAAPEASTQAPAPEVIAVEDSMVQTAANTANKSKIGEEKAKEIALTHAGLKESDVHFIKVHLDYDDGREVYDIEFYRDMTEYDYEIDAYTGDIWSYDFDIEGYAVPQKTQPAPAQQPAPAATAQPAAPAQPAQPAAPAQPAQSAGQISLEQAKQIAMNRAGVSGVTFTKAYLDYDDGRPEYDIEFISGTTEYDFEIDAATGTILEFDAESIYDD